MNHRMFCSFASQEVLPFNPSWSYADVHVRRLERTYKVEVHRGITSVQSMWAIPLQLEAGGKVHQARSKYVRVKGIQGTMNTDLSQW